MDAVRAEALLAGRGVPREAPAGQRALARLLEVAAGPGSAQELAGEVAAAAAFVQVTSQAKARWPVWRALVAAASAVAVGGIAVYAIVVPSPHHKIAPVPFGVPAVHDTIPAQPAAGFSSWQPGRWQGHPTAPSGHYKLHPPASPGVPLRRAGR